MFNKINHLLLVIKDTSLFFSFSPMPCSCLASSCGRGHDILNVETALTILFIASKERYSRCNFNSHLSTIGPYVIDSWSDASHRLLY
jgi:hypothetical protein